MSFANSLIAACYGKGLTVAHKNNVFTITKSQAISTKAAREVLKSLNYTPLFSLNRHNWDLQFTVVPYVIPPTFYKVNCKEQNLTLQVLAQEIESVRTKVPLDMEAPVLINGRPIFDNIAHGKDYLLNASRSLFSPLVEFLDEGTPPGTALDLGCGVGQNSFYLLKKGWKIVAIDNNKKGLDALQSETEEYLKTGQLTLIEADIATYPLEDNKFELALCSDVLPYIEPKNLISLVKKIHQTLNNHGRFLGSLFLSNPKNIVQADLETLGAHFYPGSYIAPSLFNHTHFKINDCFIHWRDPIDVENVLFDVTKIAD